MCEILSGILFTPKFYVINREPPPAPPDISFARLIRPVRRLSWQLRPLRSPLAGRVFLADDSIEGNPVALVRGDLGGSVPLFPHDSHVIHSILEPFQVMLKSYRDGVGRFR
jgi:hypothetical protein